MSISPCFHNEKNLALYYTGRLFWYICSPTIFNAIKTCYNNACACNRFSPLGYFVLYRISSNMHLTADLPCSEKQNSCGQISQEDVSSQLGSHWHHSWHEVIMASLNSWCLNKQKLNHFFVLLPEAGITRANTASPNETHPEVWDPD